MLNLQKDDQFALRSIDQVHRVPGYVWEIGEFRYVRIVLFVGFIGEMAKVFELVEDDGALSYHGETVVIDDCKMQAHELDRLTPVRKAFEPVDESTSTGGHGLSPQSILDREVERISELIRLQGQERTRARIDTLTYVEVCSWFNQAFELNQGKKPFGFFRELWNVFRYRTDEERCRFVTLRSRTPNGFKKYFKSTTEAYRKAREFVEIGRKNRFGYTVLAKDGHVCNSIGEARIDDYLFEKKAAHMREAHYPGSSKWRADFLIGRYYVEFFGLAGNVEYDQKTRDKIRYARALGIDLIEIYPWDLDSGDFAAKLEPAIRALSKSL